MTDRMNLLFKAELFLQTSGEYFTAASALMGLAQSPSTDIERPRLLLLLTSAELALKAVCIKSGSDDDELKNRLSHKLVKILRKCVVAGYQIAEPEAAEILWFDIPYRHSETRYSPQKTSVHRPSHRLRIACAHILERAQAFVRESEPSGPSAVPFEPITIERLEKVIASVESEYKRACANFDPKLVLMDEAQAPYPVGTRIILRTSRG